MSPIRHFAPSLRQIAVVLVAKYKHVLLPQQGTEMAEEEEEEEGKTRSSDSEIQVQTDELREWSHIWDTDFKRPIITGDSKRDTKYFILTACGKQR